MSDKLRRDIQAALRGVEFSFPVEFEILKRQPHDRIGPSMPASKSIMIGGRSKWRFVLPYGQWTTADGTKVLFDRWYCALWERSPAGVTKPAKNIWVENIETESWFFDDSCTPWANDYQPGFDALARCVRALFNFGITIEPTNTRAIKEAINQAPTITKTVWNSKRHES